MLSKNYHKLVDIPMNEHDKDLNMLSKNYHKLVDIPMNEHDKDLNHVIQELS